jgi:ATP:ADP antiporter, AAA family
MTTEPQSEKPKSVLDKLLGLAADVRAGEGFGALLMLITLFVILSAYYALKTAREGLILGDDIYVPFIGDAPGDEVKIGATGAMAMLMLVIVPAYSTLANRVDRKHLLQVSYILVVGFLATFFLLDRIGYEIGLGYFIWLGIVSMFLIAQFWSYANDIYTEEQGKRLFAIIAIGGTAGAFVGPLFKKFFSTVSLLLLAGGLLFLVIVLLGVIDAKARENDTSKAAPPPLGKAGGFSLVLRDRYLFLIGVMLVLANFVNTSGENILSNTAKDYANSVVPAMTDAAARKAAIKEAIGDFYSTFFFIVNLVGFGIQTFLASRIIKYAGIRTALFVMPAIALMGYGSIGLIGGLALIRVAKTAENSVDYSLQNTVRQSLFLPTSRDVKYKAKAAIDTFFVRFGDAAAAVVVLFGVNPVSDDPTWRRTTIAFICAGVVILWLFVAMGIAKGHKQLEAKGVPEAKVAK